MGSITVQFCDLCKRTSNNLKWAIAFGHRDNMVDATYTGYICDKCYIALTTKLKQIYNPLEVMPIENQSVSNNPFNVKVVPLSDDNDGVAKVPSNFNRLQPTEEQIEESKKCRHPKGFTMDEDGNGIVCKDCKEKTPF